MLFNCTCIITGSLKNYINASRSKKKSNANGGKLSSTRPRRNPIHTRSCYSLIINQSILQHLSGGRGFIMDRPTKRSFVIDDTDFISRLPGEILISILSRLTIKQAIATSVLSRTWEREKLWTFYHGDLEFKWYRSLQEKGCSNYAGLVGKALDTFEQVADDGFLDSFTIHFKLCPDNKGVVDRWVQFALEKRKVKRLIFDSTCFSKTCSHYDARYDFPPLQFVIAHQRNIQALTSIYFSRVNVSCEIIEHFLASCPLLESLDLINLCKTLTHLRVSGETLALKHLQVQSCPYLTTIEMINAPNLVSLTYYSLGGKKTKFYVGNVPNLVEFSFGGLINPHLIASAHHLLTSFSCIQKLKLQIYSKEPGDLIKLVELQLPSVKQFTMCIFDYNCEHVLKWTRLLKAFPYLQKFTLDLLFREDRKIDGLKTRVDEVDDDKFPSKCLEVFEFLGFGRSDEDIELVTYLLKKMAVQPEKIILLCDGGACLLSSLYNEYERKAVSIAGRLKQIIPGDVNLLIHEPRVPYKTRISLRSQSLI